MVTRYSLEHGVYGALVTPFNTYGKIDEGSIDGLVEFYLNKGVHGLVILSLMGEGQLLTGDERERVIRHVASSTKGRVPIIVGISNRSTYVCKELGQRAVDLGASGLLIAPPVINSIDSESSFEHFRQIAEQTKVPIVLLDYPQVFGKMSVDFIQTLTAEVPEVCGIKLEDQPTLLKIARLCHETGFELCILGGMGGMNFLPELKHGSNGIMTGYSYPEHIIQIWNDFREGKMSKASIEYANWLPLFLYEFHPQWGISIRKEILKIRGVIQCADVRLPTKAVTENIRYEIRSLLQEMKLL